MTERQEVAERLRHLTPSKQVHPNYTPWYTDICKAVGGKKDPWFGILALAERLADLIDPTCKPHITSEILTESITKYTAECSNCGAIFGDFPTMEQAKTTHPVYCPVCGARVVVDDV